MKNPQLLVAMVEECRETILAHPENDAIPGHPASLRSGHLCRMCDRLIDNLEDWPAVKLHRWIGFIQCALIANRMLDLAGVKSMFDHAKNAFGEPTSELIDHLDPDNAFELELGGQG